MKNDTRIQSVVSNTQPKEPGFQGDSRGQGNFELITNSDYVHEGRLTLAKVCVGAGSQSLP